MVKVHANITQMCLLTFSVDYSAGVGRTGTFIAVDYLIEEGKSEGTVCILGCLKKLRQQRSQMVQTQVNRRFIKQSKVMQNLLDL